MYRNCAHCGIGFEADEHWKRLCIPCWIKAKKAGDLDTRDNFVDLRNELNYAHREIRYLKAVLAEADARAQNASPEAIPEDMLRILLMLCHPDKNGNTKASTKATQWLLAQRQR